MPTSPKEVALLKHVHVLSHKLAGIDAVQACHQFVGRIIGVAAQALNKLLVLINDYTEIKIFCWPSKMPFKSDSK